MTGRASSSEAADDFYARLPVFDNFARLTDASIYAPLPDGWVIGLADIERSTAAIEAGRYKAVNTAAASVIAAVANALKGHDFPFVFGGDGASFAVARRGRRDRSSRACGRRGLDPGRTRCRCGLRSCLSMPRSPRSGRADRAVRAVLGRLLRNVHGRRIGLESGR